MPAPEPPSLQGEVDGSGPDAELAEQTVPQAGHQQHDACMAPSASRYPELDEEQGSGEMPVDPLNRILYTAEAVTEGGRAGHGRTSDGRLDVQLSVPEDMGGQGGPGTNPE